MDTIRERHRLVSLLFAVCLLSLLAGTARADDPKFDYAKHEELKKVEWLVQAKGGLILTSGNSRLTSATIGALISRRDTWNKFLVEGGYAYARSETLVVVDANGNKMVDPGEDVRQEQVSANTWFGRGRYDRFFTPNNSGYLSVLASGDPVAGKQLIAGGQIGYSRQLWKSAVHEFVAEIGYDFAYQLYVATPEGTQIHSARAFLGYTGKIGEGTTAYWNVETLFNLNTEKAPNATDNTNRVGPFRDTRVNGRIGAASTFYKNCSLSLGITVKYDDNPAPRPALSLPYAAGYQPFAERLDTIVESALIVNFI